MSELMVVVTPHWWCYRKFAIFHFRQTLQLISSSISSSRYLDRVDTQFCHFDSSRRVHKFYNNNKNGNRKDSVCFYCVKTVFHVLFALRVKKI